MSNLVRMVYVSTTTNPVDPGRGGIPRDVGRVLMQSRKNNPARQIGGVLYFNNNFYFQCLEGEQQHVDQLYKKIAADPRHTRVQTILVERIKQRQFADWSMKYVALEHQVGRILQQHGHATFNPYIFSEAMIEQMLGLFIVAEDRSGVPDRPGSQHVTTVRRRWWSRLFNRRAAA